MLSGHRRLCSGQGRRYRSYRGDLRPNEGLEDADLYREKLPASPGHGHGTAWAGGSEVPAWRQGLRDRQSPTVGNIPQLVSDEPQTLRGGRARVGIGVFLGPRAPQRKAGHSGVHRISSRRTDAPAQKVLPPLGEEAGSAGAAARQWIGINAALGKRLMQAVVHDVTLHDPPAGAVAEARDAAVIINADDWGRDKDVTDRSLECVSQGVLSSVSAMVFMEDSERAAALAQQHSV